VDYGAHLPVIDFGFHKFSLEWLSVRAGSSGLGFQSLIDQRSLDLFPAVARCPDHSCGDPSLIAGTWLSARA